MSLFATVKTEVDALQAGELALGYRPTYRTGIQVGSQLYYGQAVMDGWLQSSGGDIPDTDRDPRAVRPPKENDTIGLFRGFLVLRHDISIKFGGIPNFLDRDSSIPFDYMVAGTIRVTAKTALVKEAKLAISLTPGPNPTPDDWRRVGEIVAVPAKPDPANILDISKTGWQYMGEAVEAGSLITIHRRLAGS